MSKVQSIFTGPSTPAEETRFYEEIEHGYKLTVTGVHDGQAYEWGYSAGYDGSLSPVQGRPDVDAIEKHKVTDLITIGSFTKDGKIVAAYRRETSADGRALTVVASGTRPNGTTYFDVIRYESAET